MFIAGALDLRLGDLLEVKNVRVKRHRAVEVGNREADRIDSAHQRPVVARKQQRAAKQQAEKCAAQHHDILPIR